jgi:hypothetical protein
MCFLSFLKGHGARTTSLDPLLVVLALCPVFRKGKTHQTRNKKIKTERELKTKTK